MRYKFLPAILVVFLLANFTVFARDPLILRVATAEDQGSPTVEGLYRFKELVERRTNGRVKVQLYTAGTRGQEEELLEGLRRGMVDAVLVTSAKYKALVPEMELLSLLLLFATEEHWQEALSGRPGQRLGDFAFQRRREVVMGYMTTGSQNIFTRRDLIGFGGLRGMKISAGSSALALEAWRVLGLEPVVVADSELNVALQSGWVEAVGSDFFDYNRLKLYEGAKCVIRTCHMIKAYPFILSGMAWERIPANFRTAVVSCGKEACLWQARRAFTRNKEINEELSRKYWVRPLNPTPEEKAAWEKQILPLQNRVAAELGLEDILQEIRALAPVPETPKEKGKEKAERE
ncbi:MAG TPA: TRAP transporter substrate-binding protein [Firmicutes bacterium]|nr:TRAP transporter substrate-binding protein [Bacillota bacterium]